MDSNINFKYTIYKTTNKINGKMYIGCHKTQTPNDDYIGSGTILKRAVKKYGIENFQKEILFIFDTAEEMFAKEAEIVDKLFLESEKTYNITYGGNGGWHYTNEAGKNCHARHWIGRKHKEETKIKIGKKTSITQLGSGNSQYGTCWINNGIENKKIHKSKLIMYIGLGWKQGRKMIFTST